MRRYRALVASFDPSTDLALLFVEEANYALDFDSRLKLSLLDDLSGREVQMVGFPSYRDGQSLFVSTTEIAALHGNMIEVGGQVVGGISGGPLLDEDFRVVGVLVRGIPGGGSKNEAIRAKMAFYLDFKKQNIEILKPVKFPVAGSKPSTFSLKRHGKWLSDIFQRLRMWVARK
jgi:hypothetical protein